MSWARSVPKCEDQTEEGISPVVLLNNGFYFPLALIQHITILHVVFSITTYIGPETRKAPHKPFVGPFIKALELGIHSDPACGYGEEVFKRFDDEGCVAVELATNSEDGDFAVVQGERAGQDGAGEHGWDGDIC